MGLYTQSLPGELIEVHGPHLLTDTLTLFNNMRRAVREEGEWCDVRPAYAEIHLNPWGTLRIYFKKPVDVSFSVKVQGPGGK